MAMPYHFTFSVQPPLRLCLPIIIAKYSSFNDQIATFSIRKFDFNTCFSTPMFDVISDVFRTTQQQRGSTQPQTYRTNDGRLAGSVRSEYDVEFVAGEYLAVIVREEVEKFDANYTTVDRVL